MRTLSLLLLLPCLVACTSPETMDSVGAKVVGGCLLTYVDGDVDDGTTTLLSAPLLTYRGTELQPGYERTATCFAPLLFRYAEVKRDVRVERVSASCPPDEQDDGWWEAREPEAPRKRELTSKEKARVGITPSGGRSSNTRSKRQRRREREKTRRRRTEKLEADKTPEEKQERVYERVTNQRVPRGWRGHTLKLDRSGSVLDHKYPSRKTELSILWPLISLASERPGRVAFEPEGGRAQVYEVGPDTTSVRFLPLFSHRRKGKYGQTILWPLLGFGWESTPKGTYIRLFYFLRFKID